MKMNTKRIEASKLETPPFGPIRVAARATGKSEFAIRNGVRNGTIPHIMEGSKALVDIPALLAQMHEEAAGNVRCNKA